MSYLVGLDTGGTFTDFVLFDPETQELAVYKFPFTPEDPSSALTHGTTVATNVVLQNQLPDRLRAIVRRLFPEALVSLSSEALREFREYKRFSTTVINAALLPSLNSILGVD